MEPALHSKVLFRDWLFYVISWTLLTLVFTFILLNFVRTFVFMLDIDHLLGKDELKNYFISDYQYLESLLFGIFFGTATFGINNIIDRTAIHKQPAGRIILIKTLLYALAMVVVFIIIVVILVGLNIVPDDWLGFITNHSVPLSMFFGMGVFFLLGTLLINFLAMINKKFGPGNLALIFLGKYHQPVIEDRIFMFLDLDSSTTIAEQLGHIRYSRLLQDCFLEFNKLIPRAGAQIYQYVGDEVVVTWPNGSRSAAIKPVQLFFAFKKRLHARDRYYRSRYGLIPEFKAGIHGGFVTVAEIGDIKREIAYHGDVVNTASRLRSACNNFGKSLLTSEHLASKIDSDSGYDKQEIGKIHLKGKISEVVVFSIE